MQRDITGFHADEAGDWVAELECGHAQHVRHAEPMHEREWVLSEEGRDARLGTRLDCPLCTRREIPEGHTAYRRTPDFDEHSLPPELRRAHTTHKGIWAQIHVEEGQLLYRLHEPFDEEQTLDAGTIGIVIPEVKHEVEPLGSVRIFIEFYRAP